MKPLHKVAIVAGGYVAACLVASAVTAVRVAMTSGPEAQASSGMYAFGDAVVFVAVFGVCALLPTAAALVFLRSNRRLWTGLWVSGLVVAATGVTAAILFAVGRHDTSSVLGTLAGFSVLRILVAPLFALFSLVFALCSPDRRPRRAFIAATAMEAAVTAYGGVIWFLPLFLERRP